MLRLPRFRKSSEVPGGKSDVALPPEGATADDGNGCGFLGFFKAATSDLARDIELRANAIGTWEGQSMLCATGRDTQKIALRAIPQKDEVALRLQASIPGSSYVVQSYLFKGTAEEAAEWLRGEGLPDRLDRLAKDLAESAWDKAGEYPFG